MDAQGLSIRAIARRMHRSSNTISYELGRNEINGTYDADKADHKARLRRKDAKYQRMKIPAHSKLQERVDTLLIDDLSPEAVAGRITAHEKQLPSISKNSIRRYIESVDGRMVAWHRIQKRKRRVWRKKRPKVKQLTDRTFIDKRPQHIQNRRDVGHAEADFIVSGKNGKGILLTVADRKMRVIFIEQILEVSIEEVHRAFARIKERFLELKSVSTDNDILLVHHKELERLLGIKIYFCHPYHSWEKGTIENTNRYIRKDIPKGSNISQYSKQFITNLEAKLNRRPMKVLNYRTPQEMLDRHRKQKQRVSAVRKSENHIK